MARGENKLTARKVAALSEPGIYGDGGGLWLQVARQRSGAITKSWVFRYMLNRSPVRWMGLGSVRDVSLAEARDKARDARRLILDGIDPLEARNAARAAARLDAARGITFEDAAKKYIAAHEAGWKNPAHRKQWSSTLETYAYPRIGELPVADIDTALVLKVLEPIWTEKPETASRVRGRVEAVLDWTKARGFRDGENPARWRGHLDKLLPAKSRVRRVRHQPAMPYGELPAFMKELRQHDGISARALEFTILTAVRTSEAIRATWAEFDLNEKTWTVPGDRTKSGRPHRVPLPPRAVEILEALPREKDNPHVFVGARKGRGLSNMAMLELLRDMSGNGYTVHGFRSSFRDWAAETTAYPNHVVEMALAHVVGDRVEAAYRRGDLFEKRRRLMRDWARHCAATPKAGAVVRMVPA